MELFCESIKKRRRVLFVCFFVVVVCLFVFLKEFDIFLLIFIYISISLFWHVSTTKK